MSSINSLPALENRRRRNLRQPCQRSGEGPVQGKATRLSGYAAVYNSDREDLGGFTEQIAPGAFDAVLASGQDVCCLVNHDPSLLLGGTLSGTLTLRSDSKGLFHDVSVPDIQLGRDTPALAERGDITQSSFGFTLDEDDQDAEEWHRTKTAALKAVESLHVNINKETPHPATVTQLVEHYMQKELPEENGKKKW